MTKPESPSTKCKATFLDLPPEVRVEIYKYVFKGQTIRVKDPNRPSTESHESSYNGTVLSLLFVNKMIYAEALEILLLAVVFNIPNCWSAEYLVEKLGRTNTNKIQKILIPVFNMIKVADRAFHSATSICDRYLHADGLKAFQPEILLLYKDFAKLCLDSEVKVGRTGIGVVADIVAEEDCMKPCTVWKLRMYGVYALVKKGPQHAKAVGITGAKLLENMQKSVSGD